MRVRKRGYTVPIPKDAKIFSRKKIQYARFVSKGKTIEAKLTGDGKRVLRQSEKWYISFEDNLQRPQCIKAFTNEQASRQLADKIQQLMNYRGASTALDTDLLKFVEKMPSDIRDELISFGVIDNPKAKRRMDFAYLFAEYEEWLRSSKFRHGYRRTKASCDIACARTKKIAAGCGFGQWSDIKGGAIEKYLGGLNLSPGTYNGYVVAFKTFCKWVTDNDFAEKSPVKNLKMLAKSEDEHRRALTPDEVQRLINATETAPDRYGATGHDRAVFYLVAVETGIRRAALLGLTVSNFDFDSNTVNIEAENVKQRKKVVRYLKRDRAEQLKEYFRGKLLGARAFQISATARTADMIKADLKATKVLDATGAVAIEAIPFKDAQGRKADLHALKHTYITSLDATDATLNERMVLTGHSRKGNLTLGTYTHVDPGRLYEIIEQLPDYQWPMQEAMRATGTDGRAVDKILPFSYQPKARQGTSVESGGIQDGDSICNTPQQPEKQSQHSTV